MKFTENFNLNLPDLDDMADVEKLNENFQTIDTTMKSLETDPELAANVVDIKNKIGTESDADTQPTLFGRLAQMKNVLLEKLAEVLTKVTGIDGKIGTIGDAAGEESLVGLIKGVNESVKNGEGFYRYSTTEIKKNISNWSPKYTNGRFYGKLATFRAEKNGTIYLKLKITDKGSFAFSIYNHMPYQVNIAPEKTNIGASIKGMLPDEKAYFYHKYTSEGTSITYEWVISVTAGADYTFLYIGYSASSAKLEEFLIGYTDTKEA